MGETRIDATRIDELITELRKLREALAAHQSCQMHYHYTYPQTTWTAAPPPGTAYNINYS